MEHQHTTIFRDRHRYVLGPSVTVTSDGDWIVAFNMSVMREVGPYVPRPWEHPPTDPEYRNYLTRSQDEGQTWNAPRVLPGYDWHGLEHAALCVLSNGDVLASVYQRLFFPLETAERMPDLLGAWTREPYPWAIAHGGTYVHRSRDGGRTWDETVEVDTNPYVSGYSPRGAVELADGTILLPLAVADPFDVEDRQPIQGAPKKRDRFLGEQPLGNERDAEGHIVAGSCAAFVGISRDGGHSWKETREIARHPTVTFFEPTLARLAGGRLISHLRTEVGPYKEDCFLYQVTSDDDGLTWSDPWKTPMWGQPAHIVQLPDGRVLSVYGYRRVPYGIRGCLSEDGGDSWDIDHELIIRDDIVGRTIGYPTAIALGDGTVFAVYWTEDAEGVTAVEGTRFRP